MEAFDYALGFAEFVLVAVSIVWLLVALWRPKPRRLRRAGVLALVLALTVAQPLGMVVTRTGQLPLDAVAKDPDAIHVAKLFGVVPLVPFVLYPREYLLADFGENSPTMTARARSWLWLPVLTNATKVADLCADSVFEPCWGSSTKHRSSEDNLRLATSGGDYWVTFVNPDARRGEPFIPRDFEAWRLRPGIASPAGLAFWVLAGGLLFAARRRRSG